MRRLLGAAALTGALLLAACGGDEAAAPPAVPQLYDLDHDPTAGVTPFPPGAVSAEQLRLVVQQLFEWHSISLTGALRATATSGPAQDGWVDQLAVNSDELAQAVAGIYGPAGGKAFDQQWAQHAQFLVDYAAARQRGDAEAAEVARTKLTAYERDAGLLLARATGERVTAAVVEGLLREHVDRMLAAIDRMVAGDDPGAVTLVLEDHAYLTDVADALAGAFAGQFPDRFAGELDTGYAAFCSIAQRAVGAYALAATAEVATTGTSARLDGLAASVDAALAGTGAGLDPRTDLLDGWRRTFAADPDAVPAAVKRSLADAAAVIDGAAPGAG